MVLYFSPMPKDDDLDELSISDPHRYEADRKRRALERKLRQMGEVSAATKLTPQKTTLKLHVLKHELTAGQKNVLTKQDRQMQRESTDKVFGTKSREQQVAAAQLDANFKPQPDQMVQQGQSAQAAKDEQQREGEIQSQPA